MSGIRAVNAIHELQKFSDENDSSSTENNIIEKTREELLINLEKKVDQIKINKFLRLINRRSLNEPIAYILKKRNFGVKIFL